MAVERSLIINAKDTSNNAITTTIKNINPSESITKYTLKMAAVKLNNLTTNTYVSAYVVNTEDVSNAQPS